MLKAEKRIRETVRAHNLIAQGDHIVIGLSGGPDSVCLFHVLLKLAEEMDLTIHPVHVNHRFRPGAAEADQKYVEQLCEEHGLKASVFTVDCGAMAKQLGMTSEEAGRKARYDAFCQVAAEVSGEAAEVSGEATEASGEAAEASGEAAAEGSDEADDAGAGRVKIAVAHNANDQAETVLLRILRGTGMDGIAGMAYSREERPETGGAFRIVRPLLDVWRDEVEEYCGAQGLEPVTDHTNSEELYTRNKIRLDLIPHIEEKYNSNFQEGLVRMAKIAAADKEFFWEETARAYAQLKAGGAEAGADSASEKTGEPAEGPVSVTLDWRGLAQCRAALRHRIVLKAFGEIGLTQDITAERLEAADKIILGKAGGKTVEFPHGYALRVGGRKVTLFRNA